MHASNSNDTHAQLASLFLSAARTDLEIEILTKMTISRSEEAMVFDAAEWGRKEVLWCEVRALVQSSGPDYGLDGLCNDVVAAMIDGIEVIQ